MENYKKALDLFVGDDPIRTSLNRPFIQGEKYYSTNGSTLICIDICVGEILLDPPLSLPPDPSYVIPKESNFDKILLVEDLKERLKIITLVTQKRDCLECHGNGYNDCDLGDEHECETCLGEGEVDSLPYEEVPNPKQVFKLEGVGLLYSLFYPILEACDLVGETQLHWTYHSKNKANVFRTSNIIFLIMPNLSDDTIDI